MNPLYLTGIIQTYWLQMLDEYWDERDTPYSDDFELRPEWLFQHFNELPLGEAIGNTYLTWKSEQQILPPKNDIMRSLVPLVEHYFCGHGGG